MTRQYRRVHDERHSTIKYQAVHSAYIARTKDSTGQLQGSTGRCKHCCKASTTPLQGTSAPPPHPTHLLGVLCLKVCVQLLIDALMVVQTPQPVQPRLADLLSAWVGGWVGGVGGGGGGGGQAQQAQQAHNRHNTVVAAGLSPWSWDLLISSLRGWVHKSMAWSETA
jgi:hypothetical protein